MTEYEEIVRKAMIAEKNRNYVEAVDRYKQAIDIVEALQKPRMSAVLLLCMGRVFEKRNDAQRAVNKFDAALTALAKDEELRPQLEDLLDRLKSPEMGKEYESKLLGDHVIVVPDMYSLTVTDSLGEATQDPMLVVKVLIEGGDAYFQMPQSKNAKARYQMALARDEITASPELQAIAHTCMGLVQSRYNEISEAAASLEKAVDLFDLVDGAQLLKRRALAVSAAIHYQQGNLEESVHLYEETLTLYQQANDVAGQQRLLANMGHMWWKEGDVDKAQPIFEQALELEPFSSDARTLLYLHWVLGDCLWQRGDLTNALTSLEASVERVDAYRDGLASDEGQVAFLDSIQEIYDTLLKVRIALLSESDDFAEIVKVIDDSRGSASRAMLDARGARRKRIEARTPRLQRPSSGELLKQICDVDVTPDQEPPPRNLSMNTRLARSNTVRPMQSARSSTSMGEKLAEVTVLDAGDDPFDEEIEWRDHESLQPLARLIYYVLPEKTVVIGVGADGETEKWHTVTITEHDLTQKIDKLRRAMAVDDARNIEPVEPDGEFSLDYHQLLKVLYKELVAPVVDVLPSVDTPIVIEPHGVLWLLPFAALLDQDDNWFGDRAPLLYSPAYDVVQTIRKELDYGEAKTLKTLIVGNPTMPEQVTLQDGTTVSPTQLLGAEREANRIANTLSEQRHTLLLNSSATVSELLKSLRTHQVIHLATHGVAYKDDPNDSFIILADDEAHPSGLLTVRDVYQKSVAADLVVLSACQTALGKVSAVGIIGLARAFLTIGARTVLVSQWSVNDTATADLMELFYQYYYILDDKAAALHRAMQDFREKSNVNGREDPRYWSPFIVIGAEM